MLRTIPFTDTCPAGSELTLVSTRIGGAFTLRRILADFAPGCENLLALRFFVAIDDNAPATGQPSGTNLLQDYGQTDAIVGDDNRKEIEREIRIDAAGTWLKVYAANTDGFDHTVDVRFVIDLDT